MKSGDEPSGSGDAEGSSASVEEAAPPAGA
jgi:hypothetical protein